MTFLIRVACCVCSFSAAYLGNGTEAGVWFCAGCLVSIDDKLR